jgi:hypothetical protein
MKTREQIITDMCYTWRHDYGLAKEKDPAGYSFPYLAGMDDEERKALWNQMAQLYDRCIAPNFTGVRQDSIYKCRVCGLEGTSGYVCPRYDCPVRITC